MNCSISPTLLLAQTPANAPITGSPTTAPLTAAPSATTTTTGTPAPAKPPADPPPAIFGFFSNPIVMIGAVFLISTLLFGNKGKKAEDRKRTEMLKQLKRGDRVQTIGGILGAVVRAEESRVEVKVDESNNVKIWFARNAISKVVEADKAEAK